jgi:hypothetical protein
MQIQDNVVDANFFDFVECPTSYRWAAAIVKGFVTALTLKAEPAHTQLAIMVACEYDAWRYVCQNLPSLQVASESPAHVSIRN